LRARYVAAGSDLAGEDQPALGGSPSYEESLEEALRTLQERHPELAEQLEQASGIGGSRAEIIGELRQILARETPDRRKAVVDEYGRILNELHAAQAGHALGETRRLMDALARFSIAPWAEGWAYYTGPDRFENWVGVALTALLLSLGAPFWFNMLRSLANLRDQMQPVARKNGEQPKETHGAGGGGGASEHRRDATSGH